MDKARTTQAATKNNLRIIGFIGLQLIDAILSVNVAPEWAKSHLNRNDKTRFMIFGK